MNILVKLPSRGRALKVLKTLSRAIALSGNLGNTYYQLTLDTNDSATNNEEFDKAIQKLTDHGASINVIRGTSSGKIHACNRDMSKAIPNWDIVVLLSDDMLCQVNGWDDVLRFEMQDNYPDLDGVLWHSDGYTFDKLNTMCILGRKYFERFNYIYHPAYKSLWCDNEFMDVANALEKQTYFPQVLFKHEHPANTGQGNDDLYRINDSYYHEDGATYNKRKSVNFGL